MFSYIFSDNQISSVQRQLNLYGFKCISRGEFKRSFFHPKFKKGDWETVRKLTRYIPVKKNTLGPDKSDDGSAENITDTPQSDVKQPPTTMPMFMPYIYPYPHAIHPGQIPHGVQMRAYPVPPGSTAGSWPEGWGQGVPHTAYPQHTQNGVPQHHMYAVPPTSYPASQPAENKVSELSNRLGFQSWAPGSSAATTQSSNNFSSATQPAAASIPKDAAERVSACAEQQSGMVTVSSNNTVTVNPDYDLMAEFGIFDFPDLMRPSSPTSATATGSTVPALNLPPKIDTSPLMNAGSATVMTDASHQSCNDSSMSISSNSAKPNHCMSHAAVLHSESLSNVSTPKMRQSGVDVACNTALTYSKEYDCFVLGPDV